MEGTKYIYIFDLNEVLLDRYPAKISKSINTKYGSDNYEFVFLYSEDYRGGKPEQLPKNAQVHFLPGLSKKSIQSIVDKFPPSCFVTIGLRLPDMLLMAIFNELNVPTFMVQHGLFVDHLQRVALHKILVSKFKKVLKYLLYSKRIAKEINQSYPIVLSELFKYFIAGSKKLPELEQIKTEKLISKYALIFDISWEKYYTQSYGYSMNQFSYIGNPDYELVKGHNAQNEEQTILYICQTLVEDERYLKSDYLDFLRDFKATFKNEKIYMKLHPRSDRALYNLFDDAPNVEIGDEYRNTDVVLGHYSSLLKIARDAGKHVVIYDLKGHPAPNYYRRLVNQVYENLTDAAQSVHTYRELGVQSSMNEDLRSYIDIEESAYLRAATAIIELV